MLLRLITTSFLLFTLLTVHTQDLISFSGLTNVPEILIEHSFETDVDNGVNLFKIQYTSTDVDGNLDTLSGLVAVPDVQEKKFAPLIYQHGTVDGPKDVPSNLAGGYELALVYGAYGFICIAPDMVGLGDSRGIHPYVHAATEASAAIDMLYALEGFAEALNIEVTDQLFVTGYSQGGHAAMAAHRSLEADYSSDFTVAGSAPMSGPYDISGKMSEFTLGDEEYGFVAYLAYTALSYQAAYKNLYTEDALDEFFKPEYVNDILSFKNEEIGLFELNDKLIATLIREEGKSIAKLMLQPDALEGLLNDPTAPASVALRDNDVYEWVPQAPTRLYYCTADEQVWFQNSLAAETYMNENGAPDVKAIAKGNLSHGECVFPAVMDAVDFFKGIRDLTSPNLEIDNTVVKIYPSPANRVINIEVDSDVIGGQLKLVDTQGKIWIDRIVDVENLELASDHIPEGIYLIQLQIENKMSIQKLVIQH